MTAASPWSEEDSHSRAQLEAAGAGGSRYLSLQGQAGGSGRCRGLCRAGGDAQPSWRGAHPSPSAAPATPRLCSRRRDAGGRGSRREPALPRHGLCGQPGLSACGARFGAGMELAVPSCPSRCVPGLLAASTPPQHQARLGTD